MRLIVCAYYHHSSRQTPKVRREFSIYRFLSFSTWWPPHIIFDEYIYGDIQFIWWTWSFTWRENTLCQTIFRKVFNIYICCWCFIYILQVGTDVSWSVDSRKVIDGNTYIERLEILPSVNSWLSGESGLPQNDHVMALSTYVRTIYFVFIYFLLCKFLFLSFGVNITFLSKNILYKKEQ